MDKAIVTQAQTRVIFAVLFAAFLVVSIGIQVIAPFYPLLAGAYGVGPGLVILAGGAFQVGNLVTPVMGAISDRIGRRRALVAALAAYGAGIFLTGLAGNFGQFLLARGTVGIAYALFNPSLTGYVADYFPYERRARALGTVRTAWNVAGLAGVMAASLAVERTGIRAIFGVLSVLALAALVLLWRTLPTLQPGTGPGSARAAANNNVAPVTAAHGWHQVRWGAVATFFWSLAPSTAFYFLATWLQSEFSLSTAGIGLAFAISSAAGLAGDGLAGLVADRLGKERFTMIMVAVMAGAQALLPLSPTLPLALVLLFLLTLCLEAGWVSFLAVISEAVPGARGSCVACLSFAGAIADITVSLSGRALWAQGNYLVPAEAGAVASLIALPIVAYGAFSGRRRATVAGQRM